MMELNKIYQGDSREVLKTFPDQSVNCIVTSPPYWGLRNYGLPPTKWPAVSYSIFGFDIDIPEQECCLGLEKDPKSFVGHIVLIMREAKRVLRDDGTMWMNMGDSYASGASGGENIKAKDLVGIPWMLAFALRADGWYLRQDIIWNKPNPMPESVADRCTKAHEYIFLLSKSPKYYYDHEAIKQPMKDSSFDRLNQCVEMQEGSGRVPGKTNGNMKAVGHIHKNLQDKGQQPHSMHLARLNGEEITGNGMANKRSVWTVTTKPFKEAHFASFPEDLIVDCIKAGCPVGGVVLDMFNGAGTTMLVANKLGRKGVGIELNPGYIKISENRLYNELGMFYNPSNTLL